MASLRLAWMTVAVALLVTASGCGDDGGGSDGGGTDAGPRDGGHDAGPDDGGLDAGTDAGMDSGMVDDAGPGGCDPFTEGSCPDGEKCSVVLEFAGDGGMLTDRYFGCVSAETEKGAGVPCGATSLDVGPDRATDKCAQGLICRSAEPSEGFECHPLCDLAGGVGCARADDFCSTISEEPSYGICITADNCDPVFQTDCEEGEACYVRSSASGDVLGHCFSFSPPDGGTGAAGEPCMFLNNCAPGLQCSADRLDDGGLSAEASCHRICQAAADGGVPAPDGGMDTGMDAGIDGGMADGGPTFTGTCPDPGSTCEAFEPAADGSVRTPTRPGLCQ